MSIPTTDPIPVLEAQEMVVPWSRRLVEFLRRNLVNLILPSDTRTLIDGINNDLNPGDLILVNIVGPTIGFTITGISGGSPGRFLIIYNTTIHAMTLSNEDASSAPPNRLSINGGSVMGNKAALLVWTPITSRWIVVSAL